MLLEIYLKLLSYMKNRNSIILTILMIQIRMPRLLKALLAISGSESLSSCVMSHNSRTLLKIKGMLLQYTRISQLADKFFSFVLKF